MSGDIIHPESLQFYDKKPWSWRDPSHGEHYRTCNWCGSINPDDLAAEPTWRAEWGDRKYGWPHKFYVDIPNREPDRLFVLGSASGRARTTAPAVGGEWKAWDDLSPEELKAVEDHGYRDAFTRPEWILFGKRSTHHAKFYTIHLADPNLIVEVQDKIERTSGLRFSFHEGRVTWQPA